jgi:hypothetical protein
MPYTEEQHKFDIGPNIERRGLYFGAKNAGELNLSITLLCIDYFMRNGMRYQQINDIMGALEGTHNEFYRRVAVPYENKKIKENGDVYAEVLNVLHL